MRDGMRWKTLGGPSGVLPLQSGDTGAALGTPLPSGSSDGFSANCHVICFEPFNSSPIKIASQNICFLLV